MARYFSPEGEIEEQLEKCFLRHHCLFCPSEDAILLSFKITLPDKEVSVEKPLCRSCLRDLITPGY